MQTKNGPLHISLNVFVRLNLGELRTRPNATETKDTVLNQQYFQRYYFFKSVHAEWYTRALKHADFSAYSVSRRSAKTQHCATKLNLMLAEKQTSSVTEN